MSSIGGSLIDGKSEKEPNFYRILGCDRTSNVDQITAEYRARVRFLHPDKRLEEDDQKKEEYLRLQTAYSTLSDTQERQCYDAWLDCILPLSYEEFKRNQDAVKVSMHWATKKQTPMISTSDVVDKQEASKKERSSSSSIWKDREWCR
ncbi:hypothetical protein KIN20_017611 [Parelaphostrongylus tenuis]|uniref:J domain-containing protein n=1 Tax=Parelaphostrongylus tenuis TaxID=148309 RepID=A0AAD5N106_PARTN|nr:hypothetical protein KIN20_017611 [Parelaphostrongylus tenuis]